MRTSKHSIILVAAALIALGLAGRLLPHPPNFAPIAAIALFSGFFFRSRLVAAFFPLLILLLSDFFLGTYDLRIALTVYASLLLPLLLGPWFRQTLEKRSFARLSAQIGGASLLASSLFFLLTNAAVWLWSGMYAPTFDGLLLSYALALPFFPYTLAGDLFYTTALFGTYALATAALQTPVASAPSHA